MALVIGTKDADTGMSQSIYLKMDEMMSEPLREAINEAEQAEQTETKIELEEALEKAREEWKKLSFAIATGVINHIVENMEIHGIESTGTVTVLGKAEDETLLIQGNSENGIDVVHNHDINFEASIKADAKDDIFKQNDDGIGHVK